MSDSSEFVPSQPLVRLLPFVAAALLLLLTQLGSDGSSLPAAGPNLPREVGDLLITVLPGIAAGLVLLSLAHRPRRRAAIADARMAPRTCPSAALRLARQRLAQPLAKAGVILVVSPLPEVRVRLNELGEIFTRLLEEALRRTGDSNQPPVLHLSARHDGGRVTFHLRGGGPILGRGGIGPTILRWRVERCGGQAWCDPGREPVLIISLPACLEEG